MQQLGNTKLGVHIWFEVTDQSNSTQKSDFTHQQQDECQTSLSCPSSSVFPPSQQWDTGPSRHTDRTLATGKHFNLEQGIINLLLVLTIDLFRSWDG